MTALFEEAKLETTSGDRLRELAASDDAAIRKAVTSNPNTPTDILWKLGAEFPEQLLANPVWDLLLLENPNLFRDTPNATRISLLFCGSLPESFIELALNNVNHRVRYYVASNKNTPPTVLTKLASDQNRYIRIGVAKNKNTSPNVLAKLATDKYPDVRSKVAGNKNTPSTVLEILATDECYKVRFSVAENSNTPLTLLKTIFLF